MRIFRIIEKDEPSHWAPYDDWLKAHGRRDPKWWERAIDGFIHSELMFLKLPILFFNPWLRRRTDWADAADPAERAGLADRRRGLMRVLLTGSSGWLGRFLAPRLRAAGHEVIGLDVAPGRRHRPGRLGRGPGAGRRGVRRRGIEAVIHAGALHKPDIARYPKQAFVDVNVTGTLNLLEAAVAAGHDRFVFTSTTSLMISEAIRAGKAGGATRAAWLDESFGPLEPRNIYGVTKRSAEQLCAAVPSRAWPRDRDPAHRPLLSRGGRHAPPPLAARTSRRTSSSTAGSPSRTRPRRISSRWRRRRRSAARPSSSPRRRPSIRPRRRSCCSDAPAVIARHFPEAAALYARRGWRLPDHIDRVYDPSKAERLLGFRCRTDFAAVLGALERDEPLPFAHDPSYVSPKETGEIERC